MVNKDVQFVMKNHKVVQPFVPTDGLELYYDVKGKKNTDNYKDKLLDMSGNGRHGVLSNFAYEGVSGYRGTTEGGLLLDDVDDKIVRPAISGIEYTSASRNLLNVNLIAGYYQDSQTAPLPTPEHRSFSEDVLLGAGTYYFSQKDSDLNIVRIRINGTATQTIPNPLVLTEPTYINYSFRKIDYVAWNLGETSALSFLQLEKGANKTSYTPYIPLPIMTYQMNGNVLSFEKDGTVKRTTKDVNGNEVVVSRKGINLVRNGIVEKTVKIAPNSTYSSISYTAVLSTKDIIYVRGELSPHEDGASRIFMQMPDGFSNRSWGEIYSPVKNQWYTLEGIITPRAESTSPYMTAVSLYFLYPTAELGQGKSFSTRNVFAINLTEAYGAGNEPGLAYIQSHPEEFAWTPNPNDLIETVEIKNNLVGDLENLQGNDFEQHEDGVVTYTNEAEEGSVVRVDIDGISFQDVGSGKNIFYKNEVYSKYSEINDDYLNISIGDRFFYPIDGVPKAQYTTSFDYERDNTTTPVSMSFYYTDGTSDENSQIMSSSDRVRLTLSSAIGKTVSGVGYNPPVVLGCSWKKMSNPTMERTGLAIDTAQEDESLGVRWNKLQNPIMERV